MPRLSPSAKALSELLIATFQLNGLALAAGDELCAPSGLTSARWQVLGVVSHAPATVAYVARAMGLTRQSVQLTADALARDGFVEFIDNPHHRRAKHIAITTAGAQALGEVEARHAVWARRVAKSILREDLLAAVGTLRAVCQALAHDSPTEEER